MASDPSVPLEETSDSSSDIDDQEDEAVPDKCTSPTRVCKKATVKPKKKKLKQQQPKVKRKLQLVQVRGMLNKTTRNVIIKSIRDIPLDTIV